MRIRRTTRAWLRPGARLIVFILAAATILAGLRHTRPPHELTIEAGSVGGSFYDNAVRYRAVLETYGIDVRIVSKPETLDIIKDVATPGSGIDVGFTAQDVSAYRHAGVSAIGIVQLQPLFIFASAELGRHSVLDDLRGRRVVTLASNSDTANSLLRVFRLYDITPENTSFSFLPLEDAVRGLRAGRFDAGGFQLAADNQLIRDMAADSGLRLMPVGDARAVADHLSFLRAVVLPRGIYDLADAIPTDDTPMLAAAVAVVARKGLHPWLVYCLLDALAKTHRDATLVSHADDFPNAVGSQLEMNPAAAQWFKEGMPWIWRELPPAWASFVDGYELEILGTVLLGSIVVCGIVLSEIVHLQFVVFVRIGRRRRVQAPRPDAGGKSPPEPT